MRRVLAAAPVATTPQELSAPAGAVDPSTAGLVRDAAAAAYERGRSEGAAAAVETAAAAARQHVAAVVAALEEAVGEIRGLRAERAAADVDLALAIAEAVIGREPHDDAGVLAGRVRDAVDALDDAPLAVRVHPSDAEALEALLGGDAAVEGLRVVPDGSVAPGEARIGGAWARAELTRDAALAAVRAALEENRRG